MTDQDRIDQIESDRRRRERELLAILLLISSRSYRYALQAIRLGHPPDAAISNVFGGNAALDLTGLSPAYAESLIDAHIAGYRRAAKLSGEPAPDYVPSQATIDAYTALAAKWTASMADSLIARVLEAVDAVAGVKAKIKALREAYATAGHTADNPYAVVNASSTAIVTAYANGMIDQQQETGIRAKLKHHSILDSVTTKICKDRDGLALYADDPYWRNGGLPPLHFNCRSILLGTDEEVSDWRPTVPPMAGFGYAIDVLNFAH